MDNENFEGKAEELKKHFDELYYKGFGTSVNKELEQKNASRAPEFTIETPVESTDGTINCTLHYKRDQDPAKDKVYLNSITGAIQVPQPDGSAMTREHTFPSDWNISALEMMRMLQHGLKVFVYKTLFNKEHQKYSTYLGIDVNGAKDEYGNYPVSSYHENYFLKQPFVIAEAFKKVSVPVKQLDQPGPVDYEKLLKKANLPEVEIYHNNQVTIGYLALNPKERTVDVYDKQMNLIPTEAQQQRASKQAALQQDEKKKPWENQKVNWGNQKNNKGKGLSY